MTVHHGKREEENTTSQSPHRLYFVQHELEHETCLLEVSCTVESLRSRGSFMLINTSTAGAHIWHGCKSSSSSRKRVREIVSALEKSCPPEMGLKKSSLKSAVEVEEGAEKLEFWEALGGRPKVLPYWSLRDIRAKHDKTLRLFHMNSISGEFVANEILNPARNNVGVSCAFPVQQKDLYNASQPGM